MTSPRMGSIRIIGLDPGLKTTGWGVIDVAGSRVMHVGHGTIVSDSQQPLAERLAALFEGLCTVIRSLNPHEAAVEETFVNMNPLSTLRLGAARGVVMLAPAVCKLPVSEYAANRVKRSVVGVGHAEKDQVAAMVRRLLPLAGDVRQDAADALAIALCHAHYRETAEKWMA